MEAKTPRVEAIILKIMSGIVYLTLMVGVYGDIAKGNDYLPFDFMYLVWRRVLDRREGKRILPRTGISFREAMRSTVSVETEYFLASFETLEPFSRLLAMECLTLPCSRISG